MRQEKPNAGVVFSHGYCRKNIEHMGCLALIVICYNDSVGGAIWKAGDQYPPMKDSRSPRCSTIRRNLKTEVG